MQLWPNKTNTNFIHFSTLKFDMFLFQALPSNADSAQSILRAVALSLLGVCSAAQVVICRSSRISSGFMVDVSFKPDLKSNMEQHCFGNNMSCFLLHLHTSSILSVIPRAKFQHPPASDLEASSSSRCVYAPRRSTCHAADEEVLLAQPGPKAEQRQLNNHGCLNQRW